MYHFRRDEQPFNNNNVLVDVTKDNPGSFEYKSSLIDRSNTEDGGVGANVYRICKNIQIPVPLKYISSFFKSLELPLINTELNLELSWAKNCILINVATNNDTSFQISKTELCVPVMVLNTNDNKKLSDLLSKGFKRSVFWNEHKIKNEVHTADANNLKRIMLNSSFQGANRLFVLSYVSDGGNNAIDVNSKTKYALPRVNLTKFNVLLDGRNNYDQPISDEITKHNKLIKLTTGKGGDLTTGYLLDYKYYKDHYSITACDLSKQKELDADPRAIQQIEIVFMLNTASQVLTILEN